MSYRQLPDCNCEQCKQEDLLLKDIVDNKQNRNFSTASSAKSTNESISSYGTPFSEIQSPLTPISSGQNVVDSQNDVKQNSNFAAIDSTKNANESNTSYSAPLSEAQSPSTPINSEKSSVNTQNFTLKDLLIKPSALGSPNIATPPKAESSNETSKSFTFKLNQNLTAGTVIDQSTPKTPDSKQFTFSIQPNPSIFSSPAVGISTGSIFGSSLSAANNGSNLESNKTSIFTTNKPNASIFGGTATITPVFGELFKNTTSTVSASLTSSAAAVSTTGIFGSKAAPTASIFGSSNMPDFASLASEKKDMPSFSSLSTSKTGGDVILKCDSNLSFASLAANTKQDTLPVFASPKGE